MSRQVVPWLQAGHGIFLGLLFAAFVWQARTGWRNRSARLAGAPLDPAAVRRHRKLGPPLALLVPFGFLAGLGTTVLDHGTWLRFPMHLLVGTLLVLLVAASAAAGLRIRGRVSPWRTPHAVLGSAAVLVFAAQVTLGLSILF